MSRGNAVSSHLLLRHGSSQPLRSYKENVGKASVRRWDGFKISEARGGYKARGGGMWGGRSPLIYLEIDLCRFGPEDQGLNLKRSQESGRGGLCFPGGETAGCERRRSQKWDRGKNTIGLM